MSTKKSANPWRYRCPEGHSNWKSRGNSYFCEQCDSSFDELRDMKRESLRY